MGGGLEEGETAIGDGGGVNWKDDGGGSGTLRIQPLVKAAKGPTPALAAAIENKSKVAAHLLKFTAEDGKMIAPSSNLLNVIDQNQRTMLHYAAISGSMELMMMPLRRCMTMTTTTMIVTMISCEMASFNVPSVS